MQSACSAVAKNTEFASMSFGELFFKQLRKLPIGKTIAIEHLIDQFFSFLVKMRVPTLIFLTLLFGDIRVYFKTIGRKTYIKLAKRVFLLSHKQASKIF